MAPIRYSLHYEDYSEHLMSRFGKLLQTQALVDMTLMCSSHTLRVHKAVLAASSAYFQEVLQKQTGEPLIILKMRFGVLKCLVEFMYCGKTQCLEENLDELVSAAQFLKIKGLSKVTKEGLGINYHGELPVFTPPVVINRPPQSLIDLHSQDMDPKQSLPPLAPSSSQPVADNINRPSKHREIGFVNSWDKELEQAVDTASLHLDNMVVRIPFDIEGGAGAVNGGVEYADPSRGLKPRRGRPSFRRSGGWDGGSAFGRAAERALLRREQDSRKAIHQLKHLQTRHMQDYMDRVTLSQAVSSICDSESASHNYMNIDNDLIYMDQTVSTNVLDPTIPYSKDHALDSDTITSVYPSTATSAANDGSNGGISNAMSQYVNALKSAGLPTDLPILFESGDGSYINVNEQVLLDMVQSSEIQYEVIEQPNIMEKVSDPSEIKSIDDLSKSIERGEMLMGSKSYPDNSFDKDRNVHEDTINSLNAILPDNLDSYNEQQNYVVLGHGLQDNNQDSTHDFSCIESDMQFFTKSMSDDVKKYYEVQQLNDAREIEQLCPTSTALDTSFNMSLLDSKSSHLNDPMSQPYSSLNAEDLRRNDDCYDFSSQLPNTNDFKDDTLDYLIATPKHISSESNYVDDNLEKRAQERDEIIKDLMNIECKITSENNENTNGRPLEAEHTDTFDENALDTSIAHEDTADNDEPNNDKLGTDYPTSTSSLLWDIDSKENNSAIADDVISSEKNCIISQTTDPNSELPETLKLDTDKWDILDKTSVMDRENDSNARDDINSTLDENIPFAVGLLPLKQIQPTENECENRKRTFDEGLIDNVDSKYLKRKVKYKKT